MEDLVLIALIGIVAGTVKGISGFGSSLVSIPLLTLVLGKENSQDIIVMMFSFNVLLNSLLLVENKGFKISSLKDVWIITVSGIIFTLVGIQLLSIMDPSHISTIAGILIIVAILNKVFSLHIKLKENILTQVIVGALSGVGNGIASIDGPPVVFYLTSINAEQKKFKNILATHFLVIGVIAVIGAIISGLYTTAILSDILYFSLFAVIGLVFGMIVSRKLNEVVFQRIVLIILIFLAISMFI